MTEEQRARARQQAALRRASLSADDVARRRERDRERKRLKSLDQEYKQELNIRSRERKASLGKETIERIRERDRIRKRKEYKVSTAGTYECQFDVSPHYLLLSLSLQARVCFWRTVAMECLTITGRRVARETSLSTTRPAVCSTCIRNSSSSISWDSSSSRTRSPSLTRTCTEETTPTTSRRSVVSHLTIHSVVIVAIVSTLWYIAY